MSSGFINPKGRPSGPTSGSGRISGPGVAAPVAPVPVTAPGLLKGDKGEKGDKGDKGSTGNTGAQGVQGATGSTGGALSVVAIATIPAYQAVTHSGDRASSANAAHFGKVVGITKDSVSTGFAVAVSQLGELVNVGWSWTPGDIIYLNGNLLSSVSPVSGFVQKLGIAKNSTTIIVELAEPVLL